MVALAVAIRARAQSDATVVGVLRRGDEFTVLTTAAGWRHVTTVDGVTGWVEAAQIRRDERLRP
ncbi:SH3 domain-containing protein [Streptomyces sp. NPDC048717]|uniref:SH3 domain-containing protein n=1 Tax=Streptomyces sp. NPDC048717 TaxID=3154928 RepID=UPI00342ED8B5